jgi:hypothetical protein
VIHVDDDPAAEDTPVPVVRSAGRLPSSRGEADLADVDGGTIE